MVMEQHDDRPQRDDESMEENVTTGVAPNQESPPTAETDWRNEAEKSRDESLRLQAEMVNMKKRLEREKADFLKYANESLVKDLLPVRDNLERALQYVDDGNADYQALAQGVRLTFDGFVKVLEKFGVKPVSALGDRFNPHMHEAVMQREDPDVEDNTVVEEVQKGFLLNDRLIRPAMVVVSKRPAGDVQNGD